MIFQSLRKYSVISLLILGIPYFLEIFLTIFYPENCSKLFVCDPAYIPMKLFQIGTVFFVMYLTFILNEHRKLLLWFWIFLIYIPTIVNLASIYFSGFHITTEFLGNIFNTHFREVWFFIKRYWIFFTVNICFIILVFFLKINRLAYKKKYYGLLSFALFLTSVFMSKLLPVHTIVNTFYAYLADIREMEECMKSHKTIDDIGWRIKFSGKQTYVLVIGESVDRKHMGIYGYERQTTPCFYDLKDELFVFKNVNTAHVITAAVIKDFFQFRNGKNEKPVKLIPFLKDAGFKTFWFSNQGKIDFFDNTVTRLGKMCDEYAFIYSEKADFSSDIYKVIDNCNRIGLDENLLKYLLKALEDSAEKKFIVLHLNGSHCPIDLTYPPEFAKFTLPKTYYDKMKALCVCHYDNSILYTDYILNEIIKQLKLTDGINCVVYLSDHGQDILDTEDCILTARTWPNSYEVPFIVWMSEKYRQINSDFISQCDLTRHYVTDKLAYSIIDLLGITHTSIDLSNSIFNSDRKTSLIKK